MSGQLDSTLKRCADGFGIGMQVSQGFINGGAAHQLRFCRKFENRGIKFLIFDIFFINCHSARFRKLQCTGISARKEYHLLNIAVAVDNDH